MNNDSLTAATLYMNVKRTEATPANDIQNKHIISTQQAQLGRKRCVESDRRDTKCPPHIKTDLCNLAPNALTI